jgi:two-component system sensor histidine kinase/response regulator
MESQIHKSIVAAATISSMSKAELGMESKKRNAELGNVVAHDIRNTLNIIVGHMTLLLEMKDVAPDVKKAMRSALNAANMAHRMLLNLVDTWTSEEQPLSAMVDDECDLGTLIDEVLIALRLQIEKAQKTVHVDLPYDARMVRADPELMRRLLENLLENILKHTPRGGQIWIDGRRTPDLLSLRLKDDGPGIPDALLKRLFDKYAELERYESGNLRAGHGLGLWFCRLAVEAHGGRIWAENDIPRGSSFLIELPQNR